MCDAAEEGRDPYGLGVFWRLVVAGGSLRELNRCVVDLRGCRTSLPWPPGFTLEVCGAEDTILTLRDIENWCAVPVMGGVVTIFGTIGDARSLSWDRRVVAISASGAVYCYQIGGERNYVFRVADNVNSLLKRGLNRDFYHVVERAAENCIESLRRSPRLSSRVAYERAHLSDLEADASVALNVAGARLKRIDVENLELTDDMYLAGFLGSSFY
ncbi:B26 [miniopterid betaherpesvirus 1]|uniref:B26 n=1 Tax=miniopterid betaherpesvirus 1 TaxID=3070189 RepID=I3VQG7_9BETA|nr:B26 [miniopterid betaherpesvirus 1]AFK84011.1 B26 [miniopterid betaherpesvirus 1]